MNIPIEIRFWSKVDVRGVGDCWEWQAAINKSNGYGQFYNNKKNETASRVAWALVNGPIPEGMMVLHTCDNPPCVNPRHLYLGTASDNAKDMMDRGRQYLPTVHARGAKHGHAKLNEANVQAMRARRKKGETYPAIAAHYGVAVSVAHNAINGVTWGHVK